MKTRTCICVAVLLGACTIAEPVDLCEPFSALLVAVPRTSFVTRTGEFESTWDGSRRFGCEIQFETSDSLRQGKAMPAFEAEEGSAMYDLGWRMSDGILADGPGSGVFGIETESAQCIVRWHQPAFIDEDGQFVQAEMLRLTIQCRAGTH